MIKNYTKFRPWYDDKLSFSTCFCAIMAALTPVFTLLDFCASQLHSLVNNKTGFCPDYGLKLSPAFQHLHQSDLLDHTLF